MTAFAYPTVVIGSTHYTVYADQGEADDYLSAAIQGETWGTQTADQKARALVTATRLLDRQSWSGSKTSDDQEHEWPRSGTGVEGAVDDELPQDIVNATIELAQLLVDGSEVQNDPNQVNKLSSLSAGSVSLTFYHGADQRGQRFPQIVQELVAKYLGGSGAGGLSNIATGTCGQSVTNDYPGFTRGM